MATMDGGEYGDAVHVSHEDGDNYVSVAPAAHAADPTPEPETEPTTPTAPDIALDDPEPAETTTATAAEPAPDAKPDSGEDDEDETPGSAVGTIATGLVVVTGAAGLVIFNVFGGAVLLATAAGIAVAAGAAKASAADRRNGGPARRREARAFAGLTGGRRGRGGSGGPRRNTKASAGPSGGRRRAKSGSPAGGLTGRKARPGAGTSTGPGRKKAAAGSPLGKALAGRRPAAGKGLTPGGKGKAGKGLTPGGKGRPGKGLAAAGKTLGLGGGKNKTAKGGTAPGSKNKTGKGLTPGGKNKGGTAPGGKAGRAAVAGKATPGSKTKKDKTGGKGKFPTLNKKNYGSLPRTALGARSWAGKMSPASRTRMTEALMKADGISPTRRRKLAKAVLAAKQRARRNGGAFAVAMDWTGRTMAWTDGKIVKGVSVAGRKTGRATQRASLRASRYAGMGWRAARWQTASVRYRAARHAEKARNAAWVQTRVAGSWAQGKADTAADWTKAKARPAADWTRAKGTAAGQRVKANAATATAWTATKTRPARDRVSFAAGYTAHRYDQATAQAAAWALRATITRLDAAARRDAERAQRRADRAAARHRSHPYSGPIRAEATYPQPPRRRPVRVACAARPTMPALPAPPIPAIPATPAPARRAVRLPEPPAVETIEVPTAAPTALPGRREYPPHPAQEQLIRWGRQLVGIPAIRSGTDEADHLVGLAAMWDAAASDVAGFGRRLTGDYPIAPQVTDLLRAVAVAYRQLADTARQAAARPAVDDADRYGERALLTQARNAFAGEHADLFGRYQPANPADLRAFLRGLDGTYRQVAAASTASGLPGGFPAHLARTLRSCASAAIAVADAYEASAVAELARFDDPRRNEHLANI